MIAPFWIWFGGYVALAAFLFGVFVAYESEKPTHDPIVLAVIGGAALIWPLTLLATLGNAVATLVRKKK